MPLRKVGGQISESNFREPLQQQRFSLGKCTLKRGIDGLLHQAARRFVAVADSKDSRFAKRFVQLKQSNGRKVNIDAPSARMPSIRCHKPRLSQVPHGAPNDDWVGPKAFPQGFRGHRTILLGHVQQRMQDGG